MLMFSRDQHQRIGRLLGIPDCCIEAFNTGTQMIGEGVLRGPCRTREEVEEVDRAIQAIVGDPTWSTMVDPRRAHVPCYDCWLKVFTGQHPDGWMFDGEREHAELCDISHTHRDEALVALAESLEQKELSIS